MWQQTETRKTHTHTRTRTNQQMSNCGVKKWILYVIRLLKLTRNICLYVGMEKNQPKQRTWRPADSSKDYLQLTSELHSIGQPFQHCLFRLTVAW